MTPKKVGFLAGGNCHALAIARHFAAQGINCFGIGRGPEKAKPLWLAPDGYRYYRAHIGEQMAEVMRVLDDERPDTLICLAAQGEGAASFGSDSWRFYQTNCVYLAQITEQLRCRDYPQRFVHIGTSELYGSVDAPAAETAPIRASSPYSISKAAFDAHLEVLHRVHGFPMNIIRPSNCITAGQQLHRIVPRAAICAVYGQQRLELQGAGLAEKSYLDTEDLARGILAVLERGDLGATYNCGPQAPVTIRYLVDLVAAQARVPFDSFLTVVPARQGEDSRYWLDSTKLRALGWEPKIALHDAVQRVVKWARAYPELATMPWKYEVTP